MQTDAILTFLLFLATTAPVFSTPSHGTWSCNWVSSYVFTGLGIGLGVMLGQGLNLGVQLVQEMDFKAIGAGACVI